jgi:hypothetical protein
LDVPFIESMAVRLMAGQNRRGGWGYECPENDGPECRRLAALLAGAKRELKGQSEKPKVKGGKRKPEELPEEIRGQIARLAAAGPTNDAFGDNSNTQFATLAMWVARRHGVPTTPAITRIDARFRTSQLADGGWSYVVTPVGTLGNSSAAMTCAGLIGLAVGQGVASELAEDAGKKPAGVKDPILQRGVLAIASTVGDPIGDRKGVARAAGVAVAGGKSYYFLWSLERAMVALNIDRLGGRDWYTWGCEILVANQSPDGSWQGANGIYGGADTCFALLFLKRANLVGDLSARLKERLDFSGKTEMKAGGVLPGKADRLKSGIEGTDAVATSSGSSEAGKPAESVQRPTAPQKGFSDTASGRLAAELVQAAPERQNAVLERLRDGQGVKFTEALAEAVPRMEGPARNKAREALATRLARLRVNNLGQYLEDEDSEIRRAAALAVALKGAKELSPRVVTLLRDRVPTVAHAAHAALRDLSGQDFGPADGADEGTRAQAYAKWEAWSREQQR